VVLLLKIVRACMGPAADAGLATTASWVGLFALVAAVTVLYGNLGAMWQGNMKRLLGYSSIGHAGYILMGIVAFDEAGFGAIIYYLMAYLFTVLGVFTVIVLVSNVIKSHRLDDYSGLGRRSPLLGLVMSACLLSLAGVPPLGGFFGKFLIFWAIIRKGDPITYALAFVGAAGVVISLYYYLGVVKRVYMHEPTQEGVGGQDIPISRPMKLLLYTCLAGVFLMGIFHRPFMALAESAAEAFMALG
jgi:NADH-quinone oxidoreductase subunit N